MSCLLESVDRGDPSLQQIEYLARGSHLKPASFLRLKELPKIIFDWTCLRQILSDWYEWMDNKSRMILEKLRTSFANIGINFIIEVSPSDGEAKIKGIPYEVDAKRCIREAFLRGIHSCLSAI